MTDQERFTLVAARLAPESTLIAVEPLSGGISAQMTCLTLVAQNGTSERAVLRRHSAELRAARPQALAEEYQLLKFLHARQLPTPTPWLYDDSGTILTEPYLVTRYIQGEMHFAPAVPDRYVTQMASSLARIHAHGRVAAETVQLRPRGAPCRELGSVDLFSSDLAQPILSILSRHSGARHPNPPTLIHGDYWPGNTLWQNDCLVGIIDWEDAAWGDPLIDLAQTRSELAWIFGADAMATFTAAYRRQRALDWRDLPYWDLCAALRQLRFAADDFDAVAAYFIDYGRRDITGARIRQSVQRFIAQAMEGIAA